MPKSMIGFEYQETLNLGPTPLSDLEVKKLFASVQDTWPACSYHIAHRNCVTFAEHVASLLQVPEPFPGWTCSTARGPTPGCADGPKTCGPTWPGQQNYAP